MHTLLRNADALVISQHTIMCIPLSQSRTGPMSMQALGNFGSTFKNSAASMISSSTSSFDKRFWKLDGRKQKGPGS